jgi:hypothetical protein
MNNMSVFELDEGLKHIIRMAIRETVDKEALKIKTYWLDKVVELIPRFNDNDFIGHKCQCGNDIICSQHNQVVGYLKEKIKEL